MPIFALLGVLGRRLFLSLLLSTFVLANSFGPTATEHKYRSSVIVSVTSTGTEIIIDVEGNSSIPYQVHITKGVFGFTVVRDGQTVLASAHTADALSASRAGESSVTASQVIDDGVINDGGTGTQLTLHAAASDGGSPFTIIVTPAGDRVTWSATLPGAEQVTLSLDLATSGRWYGHGEGGNDTGLWPLDDPTTPIHAADFSPTSYDMDEPFWFASQAVGLWVDTAAPMAVSIDGTTGGTHRADFTVKAVDSLRAVTFIERTPRAVYSDYVGVAGKPQKSDAPDIQYTEPVWNTWAMYGIDVTQADVVSYAQNLRSAHLGGYAIQIDDRWSSKYGDFTFDAEKFPDPEAMSQQIHDLGFDLGLWMTLWINLDADNYPAARDAGYLLKSAANPSVPCTVKWWHGEAGIIDLGNPEAAAWIRGQLHALESRYNIQGLKFDTRFFDPACAATGNLTMQDYQRLGAELADEFDLQGVGVRVHWTGQQKYGFIARAIDATPDFSTTGLGRSIRQALSLSVVGYPFMVTDMVGGSASGNPTDEVLVRWAQAEVALPFWYGSTSPAGPFTLTRAYDSQTTNLYRAAVDQHRALAPYILKQAQRAVNEGEPIVKPLFFNYPKEQETYTISDEWLLGDAVLSAPVMTSAESRDIYLPSGTWYDVNTRTLLIGPQKLASYPAPISVLPLFINLDDPDGKQLVSIFNGNQPVPGGLP
jgi:alpha-glucosidase (family GH31 glycosyl hydrolase)